MSGKIIVLRKGEKGAGRHTIAQALASHWHGEGQHVLSLAIGERPGSGSLEWITRSEGLSPLLIRNYLADPAGAYARLTLEGWPTVQLLENLLVLIRVAFDWVLVEAPQTLSSEDVALLDGSSLALWVLRAGSVSLRCFQEQREAMARLHFPYAFSQAVWNRLLPGMPVENLCSPGATGQEAIGSLMEERTFGLRFREGIRGVAQALATRQELYVLKRRGEDSGAPQEKVVEQIKNRVQPKLLQALEEASSTIGEKAGAAAEMAQKTVESCLAQEAAIPGTREERSEILAQVMNEVLGLGPIEPLLKDPNVSEVMVINKDTIYVEKKGKLSLANARFSSDTQLRAIIDRIVAPLGRRVDEGMPLCDARLADGSRVNIVLPPLALDGPAVTIRKFMARALGLDELAQLGSMSSDMSTFLKDAVRARKNIVVSGGTGSGKTTLLNALSSAIPEDERIVTIEDAAELRLQKPHVVRLESRPPNAEGQGAIPIRSLVINALRMRPDRIVVGECRGGEALDMLQAMNTGHDGSLTTLHANTPRDALGRLETLVLMAGMDLPIRVVREQIRSAVHLIIQQARLSNGSRKVISITEVTGMEGETLVTQEIFRYREDKYEATGVRFMR
jgi:pilus assembly protein CpaF